MGGARIATLSAAPRGTAGSATAEATVRSCKPAARCIAQGDPVCPIPHRMGAVDDRTNLADLARCDLVATDDVLPIGMSGRLLDHGE